MTGLSRSSDGLDVRRKRMLFRCWHRGVKEMDLLLGGYAQAKIDVLDEAQLDQLEHLMDAGDNDLLAWFTGKDPVPAQYDTDMFKAVADFHEANGGVI
jgi:antitoxin CptB